jgi:hypothetical protein
MLVQPDKQACMQCTGNPIPTTHRKTGGAPERSATGPCFLAAACGVVARAVAGAMNVRQFVWTTAWESMPEAQLSSQGCAAALWALLLALPCVLQASLAPHSTEAFLTTDKVLTVLSTSIKDIAVAWSCQFGMPELETHQGTLHSRKRCKFSRKRICEHTM